MIGGPGLWIIEANPEKNDIRVINAEEAFKNNVAAFTWGVHHGYIFLGMYTTKEAADESITAIRTLLRDEQGNTLI